MEAGNWVGGFAVRRWLWPYALLAVALTVLGMFALLTVLSGWEVDRFSAQLVAADALMIQPAKGFLVSVLDMIAPFSVPQWAKSLYANLVMLAVVALAFSATAGLLLLPIFYAVYRGAQRKED